MRCIFCKQPSAGSISKEHIIPESLGNLEHTLPPGVVCDKCNQYFSIKVEKPLLDTEYFLHARNRNVIPSKRGRIPPIVGFCAPLNIPLALLVDKDGSRSLAVHREEDEKAWIKHVLDGKPGRILTLNPEILDGNILVSRFLAKVAIEALAHRLIEWEGGLDEVLENPQLEPLRRYARYGEGAELWPYNCRKIYAEDESRTDSRYCAEPYTVLHEFALLYTEASELYLVLAIFGVEYVINFAGPELEGYYEWLKTNDGKSYLNMVDAQI